MAAFEAYCSCGVAVEIGAQAFDEDDAVWWSDEHPASPEHQPLTWAEYVERFPQRACVVGRVTV
jgi:hypothetical protein